jgi:hypothetical protein
MRKGINGLALMAGSLLSDPLSSGAMFVFRAKLANSIAYLLHTAIDQKDRG